MSLDRAGFEPRRVVGFVPDIAYRESARKFESIIERAPGHYLRRWAAPRRLKSGADTRHLHGASWRAEIFALPFAFFAPPGSWILTPGSSISFFVFSVLFCGYSFVTPTRESYLRL